MATRQEILSKRPTSPHLTIYKPQISSTLSIFHRMTGVALYLSLLFISWWMISFVFYGECECVKQMMNSSPFLLVIMAFSYAVSYHLLNGIRHLLWDIGYGFSIESMNKTGWSVVMLSILITAGFWWSVL
jgi:succinate dehydrogenase / fumarate reductase cytochrome b subunit